MLGASITVAYGLATGFDRAASASSLPDAIARFEARPVTDVDARARALPNVAELAYRLERHAIVEAGGRYERATVEHARTGRRGYAVVAGRDALRWDEAVIERGLARESALGPGDELVLDGFPVRIVGVAVAPDTVAFPLARSPRIFVPYEGERVNVALLWVHDRNRLDETLAQARAASFGVEGLEFVTRDGIRVLVGRAAGIVIALLVAFSLVALVAAGVMLAASAAAEVQRRVEAIGLLRAVGAARSEIAAAYALEAVIVAAPAALVGLLAGWAAVNGPSSRLLEALNQLPPGAAVVPLLALAFVGVVAIVAASAAWPAWRVASRPPVEALRSSDVASAPRRVLGSGGAAALGARLALARPARLAAVVGVLAAAASVVLLMLTIASLLRDLESEPQTVGKRYQLTVSAPARAVRAIERVPGVAAAAARYETYAADSFQLGESLRLIAFEGEHTRFEAPELADGRRRRATHEAEVGLGLAHALNLHVGSRLAAQLPSGQEVRFRVSGIVRALEHEGRVAYVSPRRLLASGEWLTPEIAVRLEPGAREQTVRDDLTRRGYFASDVGGVAGEAVEGWAARNSGFIGILVALLRSVAVLEGLVCVYALAQMLMLTAQERRQAIAVVRALGGSAVQVAQVFAGSALLIALLAAPVGLLLERHVVGPLVGRLAASYVSLPLGAGAAEALAVGVGLALGALASAAWAARAAVAQPVVAGLRDDRGAACGADRQGGRLCRPPA